MIGVSVRTGPLRWHGLPALVGWLIGRLFVGVAALIYVAVCRPRTSGAVLGAGAVLWLWSTHPAVVVAAVAAGSVGCEVWALSSPGSWRRHGLLRALAWWRSLTVYRRLWSRAMTTAGLTLDEHVPPRWRVPRLGRVRCLEGVDVVQVRGLLGQRFSTWEDAGPMLAHVFGASDVRVHRGDDRRLTLELRRARRGRSWHRTGVLELEAQR